MLKLVADENMPAVERLFGNIADITRLPGRSIKPDNLHDTDILLVRSITGVNTDLLSQAGSLKFVGTATIGMDHLDKGLLRERGIYFSNSPGCNAEAVVDYTLSGIYNDCRYRKRDLMSLRVGVVGCGSVGGRLLQRLNALGVSTLACDPLRADEQGFDHCDIDKLITDADIICLHTPLTHEGSNPSYHLLNASRLGDLKRDALLVNAGRGAVIDNAALLHVSQEREDLSLILDVWEHEPQVSLELAHRAYIATPHIAGYSLDGKLRGSWMLYQQLCAQLGIECTISLAEILPPAAISAVRVADTADPLSLMQLVYDQWADDRRFRESLVRNVDLQKINFDQLRKTYPERREFSSLAVCSEANDSTGVFSALGFDCSVSKTGSNR